MKEIKRFSFRFNILMKQLLPRDFSLELSISINSFFLFIILKKVSVLSRMLNLINSFSSFLSFNQIFTCKHHFSELLYHVVFVRNMASVLASFRAIIPFFTCFVLYDLSYFWAVELQLLSCLKCPRTCLCDFCAAVFCILKQHPFRFASLLIIFKGVEEMSS